VAQLRHELVAIRALGAELVLVGNGTLEHLRWFLEDQEPDFPVFTDPTLAVYREAGMRRDARAMLNLKVLGSTRRARRAGFTQPGVKGDPWQQGGVLVILPGGTIAVRHASDYLGDLPAPEVVVEALRSAVVEPAAHP
jgi:hypothetical protein